MLSAPGSDHLIPDCLSRWVTIVYGKLRPYLNKVAIADTDGVCSTDILVFPQSKDLESRFLMRFLNGHDVMRYADHHSTGVQLPRVGWEALAELPVPLPPLAEQRRIVEALGGLLERVNGTKERLARVPKIMKRFRQSVLAAACSGRLTTDWREEHPGIEPTSILLDRIRAERKAALGKKYREPEPVNTSELPDLPEGWDWASWAQVGSSQNGRAFPSRYYSESGVRLLRPGNLSPDGTVAWTEKNTRLMPESWADSYPSFLVEPGELVINLTAQSLKDDFLGRVCMTDEGVCLLNQRLARLTPCLTHPRYALWVFGSLVFRRFVAELNTGSLIQHMFTSQLDTFPFPLPPFAEQHEIVRRVEVLFALADAIEKRVAGATVRAEKITQSILAKAFRGELVPTEAELARAEGRDYEPAWVMLERVNQHAGEKGQKEPRIESSRY